MIRLGLNLLLNGKQYIINQRQVGLITNQTGVNENLDCNVDLLSAFCCISALFSPEHGFFGNAQDGQKINSSIDKRQLIPIHSLYADKRKPTQEMVDGLDMLIYDIQDVGSRFYTYISTLFLSMETASECGIDFVVLDRPNPISGILVEGNILDPEFKSFVGPHPTPMRHGMTVGELAQLFRAEMDLDLSLTVVPMEGWERWMWFDQTGLQWVPPSPNMPTVETAMVYPGMCLIEGTNLSEGRGTTKPFEWIGAPWIDGYDLAEKLNQLNLGGVLFRQIHFKPEFSKYAKEMCHGVQIHITDRLTARPVEISLHLISIVIASYPDQFEFRSRFFNLLAGTDKIQEALLNNKSITKISQSWQYKSMQFEKKRQAHLIY